MNCGRSLQGGLSVAGWEFRFGALCGGLPVRVFRQVGDLVGCPVGTDWSQVWRFFAGWGASGVGRMFLMRLRNCVLGS